MDLTSRQPAPVREDAKLMGESEGIKIFNTSYVGIPPADILYKDDDYSYERDLCLNHNTEDGVMPLSPEEQKEEKKLAKQMFSLKKNKNFSVPVEFSEPRSHLERTADIFGFLATKYIDNAIAEKDPVKRILLISSGIASSFHLYMHSKKPWNPYLGETYVGTWQNGARIYGEQTSHHPPVSNFEIFGANDDWKCTAECSFTVDTGMIDMVLNQGGVFKLTLKDGTTYEWTLPSICISGILAGDRKITIKGSSELKDLTNELTSKIHVKPKKDKKLGISKPIASTILAVVYKSTDKKKEPIVTALGDFTQEFKVGDEVLWKIQSDIIKRPNQKPPENELLLSDSRYRLDRSIFIGNNMELANKAKNILEECQRREEKLRVKVK